MVISTKCRKKTTVKYLLKLLGEEKLISNKQKEELKNQFCPFTTNMVYWTSKDVIEYRPKRLENSLEVHPEDFIDLIKKTRLNVL